ncbi:tetratricopeptide repeat protein [Prosthecobacter fusiformis]|uniref:Tetratricopeptide repeat protein n=1 Tax=Prosthecobacter fusiformis TaxID=48464 RepID=A0A4R7RK25_9BACT|nr:tetratricopeptide repeat protein [Prosthecobacter fusiformis]TDU63175.1 tetratricopeptide repeat protein [Prosthecobacter fusiformis]
MRYVLSLVSVLAFTLQLTGQAPPPAAPAAPAGALNIQQETEALMAEALRFFQEAKYPEALKKIEQVKTNLNNKPFAQVLFVEGASYFNLEEYDKAIAVLEDYIKNFGDGEYISAVKMALGRSYINKGDADKGISVLKEVVSQSPDMKSEAGLFVAEALKKQDKVDEALSVLKSVLEGGIRSSEAIQAAMMAADLHVAKGELDEAGALMEKVKGFATGGDNVAQMNNIYLRLGDQMLEKKSFREALGAYQFVRRKNEITRMQKDVIAKIEQSLKTPGRGPIKGTKEELEEKLKSNNTLLAEIEQRSDYDASLYYRLGRCYFEMGRFWEALLAFDVIVNDFKEFPQRDRCVFGMIIANAQLKRVKSARELCERYINDFPDGADLGTVSEMFGMLAYENGKLQEAADAFNKAEGFPKSDRERLRFLRGNVLFEMQRFDDARTTFELLINEFPQSAYKDDALYRIALIYFYQNDSVNTTKALKNYMKENPKGQYVVDARYRLAFIKFQARDVDNAMLDLQAIIKDAPNDPNIGQVHSLLGDAYNQKGEYEKALENFALGVTKAKSDDVLSYAMDQATDLYAGTGKWKELGDMWQKYMNTHKDNEEQELKAVLWISRARVKENKLDEAKKLLADATRPKISNPSNQQVEGLIQQLVSLVAPKRRRPVTTEGAPAPEPELTHEQVATQLEELLTPPQAAQNGTSQMRILFAKAWLAKVMREPVKAEKLFAVIIDVAKPEDLSAMLLATVGDNARTKGDLDKAAACYNRLNEFFKETEYADGAAVGLAEIAYSKGEYDKALELFTSAIEEYSASSRLLDATLGKAKTLFQLKKYDEAKALYVQILNTKEWRGEAHATSLFMQGEIEFANQKWGEAIPFYQRVFIAHQKWKSIMAQSYLQCARAFLKRNGPAEPPNKYPDRENAKLLLIEMVKRTDLKDLPEMKQAELELSKL